MQELGIDPAEALPTAEDYERAANVKEYVDPLVARINALAPERTIALRISGEGYDTYSNIALVWSYDDVVETLEYMEVRQDMQDQAQRKADAQASKH